MHASSVGTAVWYNPPQMPQSSVGATQGKLLSSIRCGTLCEVLLFMMWVFLFGFNWFDMLGMLFKGWLQDIVGFWFFFKIKLKTQFSIVFALNNIEYLLLMFFLSQKLKSRNITLNTIFTYQRSKTFS